MLAKKIDNGLKSTEATQVSTLFDNLMTMEELMAMLRNQYCRRTVYRWISQGMPHKRIRSKLWFPKNEVILWLQRS
jgi:hypothetical protein